MGKRRLVFQVPRMQQAVGLYYGKQTHGHARGTFIVPTPIGVGIIPLTGIACPFSDIPQSSLIAAASGIPAIPIWRGTFAFIHVHARGFLRRRDKESRGYLLCLF